MKYYFDGCSYTKGHDQASSKVSWPKQINPKSDPNYGYVNALDDDQNFRLYPFIDNSCTARSNDAIFLSFMSHLDEIIANKTKVFLYFSHSERYFIRLNNSENKNIKPLNSRLIYNKANPDGRDITEWISGTMKTISYIKSITHIAEINDIDLVIVTQDHYRWLEFVSKTEQSLEECFNSINTKYIFNWPLPELKNFSLFNNYPNTDYKQILELWGCTGFALQMAKGFSDFNEWVSDDLKHFTEKGHAWLAKVLVEFLKDRSKNLSYYIDELDLGKQRIFYDKNAWVESYFYGKETSHWIEKELISHFNSLIKDIEKNKNYIYEG